MSPQIYYIETDIIDACNLNCAGCSHFAPLAKCKNEVNLEDFTKDVRRIGELFPYHFIFRIMGGEPLLHPQLADIIRVSRLYLKEARIELVTNGILLKNCSQELKDVINENNIFICVSNYGLNLDEESLKKDFKHIGLADRAETMYNISLNDNPTDSYITNFFDCRDKRICIYMEKGKLYHCPITAKTRLFDDYFETNWQEKMADGIDIYKNDHHTICNFLRTPIMACKYCDLKNQEQTAHKNYVSEKKKEEWTI